MSFVVEHVYKGLEANHQFYWTIWIFGWFLIHSNFSKFYNIVSNLSKDIPVLQSHKNYF